MLAESYQGEPLDCVGGVINDVTADSSGGVYFTMGGLFYANPKGVVTRYGENLTTNGVILSGDEKTLYVTNGATLAAFDVQRDGSLTNQREFAKFTAGGGDGARDRRGGRLYVTTNPGVEVIGPDGKHLGVIPTPRGVISVRSAGRTRRRCSSSREARRTPSGNEVANAAQVWSIPMIAPRLQATGEIKRAIPYVVSAFRRTVTGRLKPALHVQKALEVPTGAELQEPRLNDRDRPLPGGAERVVLDENRVRVERVMYRSTFRSTRPRPTLMIFVKRRSN